jgi:hypothetical protein
MAEILIPVEEQEWSSSGLLSKPPGCKFCSMYTSGKNFVPDFIPTRAKILFVFSAPEKDDILENRSLAGNLGWYRRNKLFKPLGLNPWDVGLTNIIRCYPGRDKFNKLAYPSAAQRISCEKLCRQYDNTSSLAGESISHGIINFNPNVFVITFGLDMLMAGAAFQHLMIRDIQKALDTIPNGGRPAVLFGEPATNLFAPYCFGAGQGGIKTWRGHIFEGSWKDLSVKQIDAKDANDLPNPFRRFGNKPKVSKGITLKTFSKGKLKKSNE